VPEPYDFFAAPRPAPPGPGAQTSGAQTPGAPAPAPGTPAAAPDPYAPPSAHIPAAPGPYGAPDPRFGSAGPTGYVGSPQFGPPSPGGYAGPPQFGPPQFGPPGPGFGAPGYGYGYNPPVVTNRPGTVTAASVLLFVQAGVLGLLMLLIGYAALVVSSATISDSSNFGSVASGIAWFLALFFGAFAALFVLLGLRVLSGHRWAAITAVVLQALAGLDALSHLGSSDGSVYYQNSGPGAVITLIWAVTLITLIAMPKSRAWFSR
jgi:hypothetical protein